MNPRPPVIVLAAGHGGRDTGAVAPDKKTNERDQAIIITDRVAEILRAEGIPVRVAPHSQDTHVTIAWANERYRYGMAWLIELHRDSYDAIQEPEASFRMGVYTALTQFSQNIGATMIAAMKRVGATAKSWSKKHTESDHKSLAWINQTKALAHLVEHGFVEGNNTNAHMLKLAKISAAGIKTAYLT